MSTATFAGLILIVTPVAFNVAFGMLAARFDYPDVLHRPTDEALSRFEAGPGWSCPGGALAMTAVCSRPLVALLSQAIVDADQMLLALETTVGVDWVIVEVAVASPRPGLLCSVLRSGGIECLPRLTNSGAGAGDRPGTVGAHDIMVRQQDAQDAREILHEPR